MGHENGIPGHRQRMTEIATQRNVEGANRHITGAGDFETQVTARRDDEEQAPGPRHVPCLSKAAVSGSNPDTVRRSFPASMDAARKGSGIRRPRDNASTTAAHSGSVMRCPALTYTGLAP